MKAIFNRNCILMGWYDPQNRNVFDKDMMWLGFVVKNYFYRENCRWLGGLVNGTFVDKTGRPVAWLEGYSPASCHMLMQPFMPMRPLTPLTPLRPLMPLMPLRPLVPLGGWSKKEWSEYLEQ